MSFISRTSSVANQRAKYGNMSPCPNIATKASALVKKCVRPVSARVSGNSRLANSPVSRRTCNGSFATKYPLSPLSPRFANKSPGSTSHPKIPSSTLKPVIRRPSVLESKTGKTMRRPSSLSPRSPTEKPRHQPSLNASLWSPMDVNSGGWHHHALNVLDTNLIIHSPIQTNRPQSGMTLRISTKKVTSDTADTADKEDSESNIKINSKGNRNALKGTERSMPFTSKKFNPQSASTHATSTKKETADNTVDKNGSEFSKFKITNKGTRNNATSRERKTRLVDAKFRETRNNFMSKMLEIRDRCFDKKVWKEIQQAFEPHIHTKKKTISPQELLRPLEGIEFFQSDELMDVILKLVTPSSPKHKRGLDYRGFLSVLSSVYSLAHPTLQPGENSMMTVVLLQDAASAATDISDKLSKAVKDLSDQNLEVIIRFMPLRRVEKMDIREQFYHLGIPVDMTLMFYDPNLPQQPNARKLRIAFPKMKICLCGDDSHLKDALGIHGELTPSQWKLRHAIADDFIVNPFLDIQIPLAAALKLKCKKLPTTGHCHLQWAKQHLNAIPEGINTVRVSTSSIDDMKKDFNTRRFYGNVITGQPSDGIPYVYQGDEQMYTTENLKKRKELFSNPEIGEAIRAFWLVLDLVKDSIGGAICMEDFLIMNIKIQKVLIPGLRINDAIPTALKDWRNDCAQGRFMTENEFFECFFEMTDIWCSTVDPSEYVIFLVSLLLSTTMVHGSPEGCLRWRSDEDITNANFKRVIKQLRVDVASGSAIMPTSNAREKWQEGAEVEVEGASGTWWWAKITACHDDGTYNVAVYDDTEGGGQEWKHVRPVHLRSRVQLERPQGIAIRPDAGIPRWGGDDGAEFKKIIGRWVSADTDDSTDSTDSECEYSSGDEAGAAGTAHKYSKDSDHDQSKPGGLRVSGGEGSPLSVGKESPLSGGKASRLSGGKGSPLSVGKASRLSGGKASRLSGGKASRLSGGKGSPLSVGKASRLSGGKGSRSSGGKGSRLSGGKDSSLSGGKGSRSSGSKARADSAADKVGTSRGGQRRRRTKKIGHLRKMARHETGKNGARSNQIFGFAKRFAGKSERGAESKHKGNSSEQRQADYDAKMSKDSKSNRTGRQKSGHIQNEATTRLPQNRKIEKMSRSKGAEAGLHLRKSGGSLLKHKSKHPADPAVSMQRFVTMIAQASNDAGRKKTVGSASLKWSSTKDNGTGKSTIVGTSKSKRSLTRTHSRARRTKSRRDTLLERQRMQVNLLQNNSICFGSF